MDGAELKVDHVTVGGENLSRMRDALSSVGLASAYGGPHANRATEMAVLSFSDGSYLELIAAQSNADAEALAAHYWAPFMKTRGTPCAWAVRVLDVSAEARRLQAAGVQVTTPARSGRTRRDGIRLDWETASVGPGSSGAFFPFLIRDFTPRDGRVYPTGKPTTTDFSGVAKVVVAVGNMEKAVRLYRQAYGLAAPEVQRDPEFGAELAWFEGTPAMLASPLSSDSPLNSRLEKFGEAPYAFVLAGSSNKVRAGVHDSHWFGKPVTWFDEARLGWRLGVE